MFQFFFWILILNVYYFYCYNNKTFSYYSVNINYVMEFVHKFTNLACCRKSRDKSRSSRLNNHQPLQNIPSGCFATASDNINYVMEFVHKFTNLACCRKLRDKSRSSRLNNHQLLSNIPSGCGGDNFR